jgi:hypothetical protein
MRLLTRISLSCLLAAGMALAQRGGGARGGGMRGGGMRGGANMGGSRGYSGYRYGGYRGDYRYRGYYRGYYGPYWGRPYWGFDSNLGYWPGYESYNPNPYPYADSAGYQASQNVTVIYPPDPPDQSAVYAAAGQPVIRESDQYLQEAGQDTASSNSTAPIYLIAFNDQSIRPAVAYWVDGGTLHYVTLDHQQMQVPLDTIDRTLSLALNRKRDVPFQLPVH